MLGLINVDGAFTEAPIAFGVTPAAELRLHRIVAIGFAPTLVWVKSEQAESFRLLILPQLHLRFSFELGRGFSMFLLLTGGMAIWPEDDSEAALDPRITGTRLGWSFRAMAGVEYGVNELLSVFLAAGYGASTTYGEGVPATIDGMLLVLGVRFRFGGGPSGEDEPERCDRALPSSGRAL